MNQATRIKILQGYLTAHRPELLFSQRTALEEAIHQLMELEGGQWIRVDWFTVFWLCVSTAALGASAMKLLGGC